MKRAERRHRSRMARKRRYRLVGDLCGVNLREVPTKVAERDFVLGPSTVPRHQWIAMSFNVERRYNELCQGEKSEVQAFRAGAARDRRVLKGKVDPKHFDLVERCLIERVESTIHVRFPSNCSCWFYGEPASGCRNCQDFLAFRLKLQNRWYDEVKPRLDRHHVVEEFLGDLKVFVEDFLEE